MPPHPGPRLREAAPHEPAVRAYFLRCAVDALQALAPATAWPPEIARALPALRSAPGLAWLPVETLLPLVVAARAELGEAGARELVIDSMRRAMGAPLWRRMIVGALRSLGLGLPAMARWVPRLYGLVYRATGTMHVPECDAHRARIEFRQVPALCLASPAYLDALGHALSFYFELSGQLGDVTRAPSEPATGLVSFVIRVDGPSGRARSG